MAPSSNEEDPLLKALQSRLISTGEWDRINRRLKRQLDDSGWTDDVKDRAREQFRAMPKLDARHIEGSALSAAQDAVPPEVKADIIKQLMEFLEDNVVN